MKGSIIIEKSLLLSPKQWREILIKGFLLIILTFFFLFAIDLVIETVKILIGESYIKSTLNNVYSPFAGLFVGLLVTALAQSSTLVTSLGVAMVASGTLSLQNAVPIVIGANIGTTMTPLLVSFGYIMHKKEFRKAIAGSMSHILVNILPALLIFPLEYYGGFLSKASLYLAILFSGKNAILPFKIPYVGEISTSVIFQHIPLLQYPVLFLVLGLLSLFACIRLFIALFEKLFVSDFFGRLEKVVRTSKWRSFLWGVIITALIHSSTIVIGFLITLIGSNKVSLKQAFPFIIGANLGTTLTALTASLGKSEAGMSIAFAHFLFNLISMLLVLPFPWIENKIILLCRRSGSLIMQYRLASFLYVLILFFLLPFLLIYLNK